MNRTVGVVVAAAVALALPAVPARAETTVKIKGGGWGHGIGMSQYGAYGRALNGKSGSAILEHYYRGARVREQAMPARMRVGLLQGHKAVGFTSAALAEGGGKLVFKVSGGARIASGGTNATWKVEASSTGGMRLFKNGNRVEVDGVSVFGDPLHPVLVLYEKHGSLVRVTDKSRDYAYGRMEVGSYQQGSCDVGFCLRLVVSLSMQKYLYGLGEVPASWPQAALRAQAIAGRTYAFEKVQRLGQHRDPCDCAVYDSTVDQAYIGDAKRTGSGPYWDDWKGAVDGTLRKIVKHDGAPIQALYSSSSGGHTENNENVWGGTPLPYLRGVKDGPDSVDANPNHTWTVSMTWNAFESKLDAAYNTGNLRRFRLIRPFGVSGRVTVVKADGTGGAKVVGSNKTVRVSGWSVRSALSLKDTLFRVQVSTQATAVGSRFQPRYERLDGAPGAPQAPPYPVPLQASDPLGQAQRFEVGRMTWRKATDMVVWQRGPILRRYDALRRERGPLGMPTSDVWGPGAFLGANYVNGSIYWSASTGARPVLGRFRSAYRRNGGPDGPLGLPTKGRETATTLPAGGKRQRFRRGTEYLNPESDRVFALWAKVEDRYRRMGEASSRCGYPISDLVVDRYGKRATFANGVISWTRRAGIEVDCA
ncbi:MAG: SpoIID/LytB domain-containing protein [Actinomycetota bacterium]